MVLLTFLGSGRQAGPRQPWHSPGVEVLDVHISVWGRLPLTPQEQTFFGRCFCNGIKKRCLEGKTLRERLFYLGHTHTKSFRGNSDNVILIAIPEKFKF